MIKESKMFDGDLYHYTTIEKLTLILENQTIRFNSLMNVDDPREGDTLDWGKIEHHIPPSNAQSGCYQLECFNLTRPFADYRGQIQPTYSHPSMACGTYLCL